jgi:hypothetical protein
MSASPVACVNALTELALPDRHHPLRTLFSATVALVAGARGLTRQPDTVRSNS